MLKNKTIKVIVLSLLHLVVDFLCAYIVVTKLYNRVDNNQVYTVFIIYNLLAFVTQPLVGLLIDKAKNEKVFLNGSLVLLIIGCLVFRSFWISVILLGLGNSFFHVAGGKITYNTANNKLKNLGIFVSLGAIGLTAGMYFSYSSVLITIVVMLAILTIIFNLLKEEVVEITPVPMKQSSPRNIFLIIALMFIVLLRGIIGKGINFGWPSTNVDWLFIAIAISLGKILGGILADSIGIKLTAIITMAISVICLGFLPNYMIATLIGLVAFNATMPITLYLLNSRLINHEGLSFGLLAATLFPGYLIGTEISAIALNPIIQMLVTAFFTLAIIIYVNKKEVILP